MTADLIEALLPGPLDVDFELATVFKFPIVLRPIARTDDRAPDYRLESDGAELGFGWCRTSTVPGIRYVAIIMTRLPGARLSSVAGADVPGRWPMQFQEICTVEFMRYPQRAEHTPVALTRPGIRGATREVTLSAQIA